MAVPGTCARTTVPAETPSPASVAKKSLMPGMLMKG
jgi:hypothetical protein